MNNGYDAVEENRRLNSKTIYEIISAEGREELARPLPSLGWSGLAAGLCITFSLFCEGFIRHHLNEENFLLENLGYTFGFVIVIIARLQLFTENTITVVLPILKKRSMWSFIRMLKLWGVVLLTNFIGTFIVAFLVTQYSMIDADLLNTFTEISINAVDQPFNTIFKSAIPAGFLIACLVWLLPSARGGAEFWVIVMMTYIIAIGDFAHIVAGSVEAFILLLQGLITLQQTAGYLFAACAGNIIGGTFLFALLAYNQIKDDR